MFFNLKFSLPSRIKAFQTYKASRMLPIKQVFLGLLCGSLLRQGEQQRRIGGGSPGGQAAVVTEHLPQRTSQTGAGLEYVSE